MDDFSFFFNLPFSLFLISSVVIVLSGEKQQKKIFTSVDNK